MGEGVFYGLSMAILLGFRDTGAQVPREGSPPRPALGSSKLGRG